MPKMPPIAPPKTAHLHKECAEAGDCNGRGWCFGQTCVERDPARRTAGGRCRTCKTRIFNQGGGTARVG